MKNSAYFIELFWRFKSKYRENIGSSAQCIVNTQNSYPLWVLIYYYYDLSIYSWLWFKITFLPGCFSIVRSRDYANQIHFPVLFNISFHFFICWFNFSLSSSQKIWDRKELILLNSNSRGPCLDGFLTLFLCMCEMSVDASFWEVPRRWDHNVPESAGWQKWKKYDPWPPESW